MTPIKIHQLEIENVKRIRAVKLAPSPNGLTIIGGRNEQGKTSVLDAIAWALGGDRYRPSEATREGSTIPPALNVKLTNGLIVERKGKNGSLTVTDPNGQKSGQQLLNDFVEQLALDLPRFLHSTSKEKATTLLHIIGVEDQLAALERQENELYNQRRTIGQIADQKQKYAQEQPFYPEAPHEPVSAMALIQQQQDILARNGENQRKRVRYADLSSEAGTLRRQIAELQERLAAVDADCEIAQKSVADLRDESTAELEQSLSSIEEINRKVRANLDKDKAEEDARAYTDQYAQLSAQLDSIRTSKQKLLDNAELPLPGLSVHDGDLTYQGHKWDNMSASSQLKVATAIVRKLNPKCGFVLLDKLEQMDMDSLREFGAMLEAEDLQVIATRVSTGGECSIIIEDGYVAGTADMPASGFSDDDTGQDADQPTKPIWKAGSF